MDVLSVLLLLGGVSLFLFGMNVMSSGLEKTAGGRLERILRNVTSNKIKAFALGIGITSVIQSSSAVTVMLVGLVNSGIMQLHQTIGVIFGTNIGTTVTAWILSLTGLKGESLIVKLLKPDNFAQVFAVAGIIYVMFSKKARKRSAGEVLLGFAVLMAGMVMMRNAVSGLEHSDSFRSVLTAFSNPILGVIFGMLITAVIQSSSASVGILQALSLTVSIPIGSVVPIIMGQNIGTCITALLSSIGTNKSAKRVAIVHVSFNVIGTVVLLTILSIVQIFVKIAAFDNFASPVSIAIIHTAFNVASAIILFPFAKKLEKLASMVVRDKPGEETKYAFLDERILAAPTISIAHCYNIVVEMGHIAREAIFKALGTVMNFDEKAATIIRKNEQRLDEYEDKLNTFLIKLSAHEMSASDSWKVSEMLHVIGDLERIGDHAMNILESAEEIKDKQIVYSGDAKHDLEVASAALTEIINMTIEALENDDATLSRQVEPLEQAIDALIANIRTRHIMRLQSGKCQVIPGFVWSDLMVNYERVSDHCSNIAGCILQSESKTMDVHVYLSETRTPENQEFIAAYNAYKDRFKVET